MDIDIDSSVVRATAWLNISVSDNHAQFLTRLGDMYILYTYLTAILIVNYDIVIASRETCDVAAVRRRRVEDISVIVSLGPSVVVRAGATSHAYSNLTIIASIGLDIDNLVIIDRGCESVLRLGDLNHVRSDLATDVVGHSHLILASLKVCNLIGVTEVGAVTTPIIGVVRHTTDS